MISPAFVVGGRFEVLEQVRFQDGRAAEVSGDDGEEAPASLAGIGSRGFVVGRLFHDVAEGFVPQRFVLVTVLRK